MKIHFFVLNRKLLNRKNYKNIIKKFHQQSKNYEMSLKYLNMGFTGMFSVETILKIIGFGVKVGAIIYLQKISVTHIFYKRKYLHKIHISSYKNDKT